MKYFPPKLSKVVFHGIKLQGTSFSLDYTSRFSGLKSEKKAGPEGAVEFEPNLFPVGSLNHNLASIWSIVVKSCQQTGLGKIFALKEKKRWYHLTSLM